MQRIAPDTKKLNTFLILALMLSPEDTLIKGGGRDKNKTMSSLKLKVSYSHLFFLQTAVLIHSQSYINESHFSLFSEL